MANNETILWEKINNAKKSKLDLSSLTKFYSLKLSQDLRIAIAEQIGISAKDGWPYLKLLIDKHGAQKELIYAAGLSHQTEARSWLLKHLKYNNLYNVDVIKALSCWGGTVSIKLIREILSESNKDIIIAGLDLLAFKAYHLTDKELLLLIQNNLNDFRESIVIKAITIIQRRESLEICKALKIIAQRGSKASSYKAIMALGSIKTKTSEDMLIDLSKKLTDANLLGLSNKQRGLK